MKVSKPMTLLFSLAVPQLAGIIASVATAPAIGSWYEGLQKPLSTPPNWIFAPAWIFLYVLMGVAWYLVLIHRWHRAEVRTASFLFLIQLALNILWTIIFFGLKEPAWAFVDILFLLPLITLTAHAFDRLDRRAGWLMVPYILWVVFATYLSGALWLLNS